MLDNTASILSSAAYILFYQRRDVTNLSLNLTSGSFFGDDDFILPSPDLLWPPEDLTELQPARVTEVVRVNCDCDPLTSSAPTSAPVLNRKRTNSGSLDKAAKILGETIAAEEPERHQFPPKPRGAQKRINF